MKKEFKGEWGVLTYVLYITSQTLLLKPYSDFIQPAILLLMMSSMVSMFLKYHQQWTSIFTSKKTVGIGFSILIVYGLFSEPTDLLVVLIKVVYMLAMASLLASPKGNDKLLQMANWSIFLLVVIVCAAQIGIIPNTSSDFEWDGLIKNYAGFINPNAPMFFGFSAISLYFLLGKWRHFIMSLGVIVLLTYINAISRTYIVATILLAFIAFVTRYPFAHRMMRFNLLFVFFIFYMVGSLLAFLVAVSPGAIANLVGTALDELLSLRIETALLYLYQPAQTITGFRFVSIDSIYFELVLVLGPIFWFLFFTGAIRTWRLGKHEEFNYRLFCLVSIVSITGLLESLFLSISLSNLFMFFVATRPSHKNKSSMVHNCKYPQGNKLLVNNKLQSS